VNRFSFTAATRVRLPYGTPTFLGISAIRPVRRQVQERRYESIAPSGFQSIPSQKRMAEKPAAWRWSNNCALADRFRLPAYGDCYLTSSIVIC